MVHETDISTQPRHVPIRMCAICRGRFPKRQLVRHVLTPLGTLTIDVDKTSPGRGWYLCSNPLCAQKFAKYRPGTRRKGRKHA